MLYGFDVSHHQKPYEYLDVKTKGHTDFVIIKLTEGVGYADPKWKAHLDANTDKLIGFYHYARPETGNTAVQEAKWFVDKLKETKLLGEAVLVLDYEGDAHNIGQDWALAWCEEVYRLTGVRPLLYTAYSMINKYNKLADKNYGLWVAKWGSEPLKVDPWAFKAIWQLRGAPLDLDIFYGDEEAWHKYAKSEIKSDKEEVSKGDTFDINNLENCNCKLCKFLANFLRESYG